MNTVYIVIQLLCSIGTFITSLVLQNNFTLILSILQITTIVFDTSSVYKLYLSSTLISVGFIEFGQHFVEKNNIIDISYSKYEIIPFLNVLVDIFHADKNLRYTDDVLFEKWLFPIKMFIEQYILILFLYIIDIILLTIAYDDQNQIFFFFTLSLLILKIIFMVYGRYTKTEIIDNQIEWCFKKRKYERLNFDRLDEDVNTDELYIGTAFNSPIIQEIYDVLILLSIGFLYGITENNILQFMFFTTILKVVLGKNRI